MLSAAISRIEANGASDSSLARRWAVDQADIIIYCQPALGAPP